MYKTLVPLLSLLLASCTMIEANYVDVVTEEPEHCEFLKYLDQAFTDNKKEGVSELRESTVIAGGNTLYLPPDKQEVLAGRLKRVFLAVGSAYECSGLDGG